MIHLIDAYNLNKMSKKRRITIMGERKIIITLIVIFMILLGKLCVDELFKTVKSNSETTATMQEKKDDYTMMYPDMYVRSNSRIPVNLDVDILEARNYVFQQPALIEDRKETKTAFLTFDDGPSENTEKVLEILKDNDIKATFFVIAGSITPDKEELMKSMVKQGHIIGIHTYSHNYREIYSSVENYLEDFYLAYSKIYEVTGVQPTIFRFPGGSSNKQLKRIKEETIAEMKRRGFEYYDWNVTAEDSIGNPSEYSIKKNVLNRFKKYSKPIILLHDSSINEMTVNVLPDIIVTIKDAGYGFDTVDKRKK